MGQHEIEIVVPKDLEDLIPTFFANRQRELASLASALADSDLVRLGQLGHRMKGAGAAYGFAPIAVLGERVERFVGARDLASLEACVAQYRHLLSNLRVRFE